MGKTKQDTPRSQRLKAKTPRRDLSELSLPDLYSELSTLHCIVSTVSHTLDIDEVFSQTADLLKEATGAQAAVFFTVDNANGELQLKTERGLPQSFRSRLSKTRLEQTLSGQAALCGAQVYVGDYLTDVRASTTVVASLPQDGLGSLVATPLKVRDRTVGVLTVAHREPNVFQQRHLMFLQCVADEVGLAFERTELFGQVKKSYDKLKALVQINKDMASLLDRNVLLPCIAAEARAILGVDGVSLRVVEGDTLVRVGHAGEELSNLRRTLELNESITGRVIREKRPVTISNLAADPMIIEEHRAVLQRAGFHSFLGVPLLLGDRVLGTINCYAKAERKFREDDLETITAFADQAAIAVQNANLFAEVETKGSELERLNQELKEINRAKSEFVAAMSHELRTPLTVILGYTELAQQGKYGQIGGRLKEALGAVVWYAKMLQKLVNDVLMLNRMDAKRMSLDTSVVNLQTVIDHLRAYVEELNRHRGLQFLWDVPRDLPTIRTDALKLEEILQNLVGNAFKFTLEGKIAVCARALPGEDRIEFSVSDTGVGIEKANLDQIFGEFYQLKKLHAGNNNGVGLGLTIVKRYLDLMGGTIRVESEVGKGSVFTFTLPLLVRQEPQK